MNKERLLNIIVKRHTTEKSVRAEGLNTYTFIVAQDASKSEISQAIEMLFGTQVKKVRTLNQKPKTRNFRGRPGTVSGFKKAYVVLKDGQFIDFTKPVNVIEG